MFDFIFHINLKETKQMRILFSFLFAGIAVRLKPTVTALLQHPLQRFRALALSGDISNLKTPPPFISAR